MAVLRPLQWINDRVLSFGRAFATVAIGLMVLAILIQVFMRYVLNNALPWPEEAARFLMLWMTGLIAPTAYRWGGFVAIDSIQAFLPRPIGTLLNISLLVISLIVLLIGAQLGYKHVFSGCLFKSSTLWLPFTLKLSVHIPFTEIDLTLCTRGRNVFSFEWGWTKMPLAISFLSLYVGVLLLISVNVELLLRELIKLFGGEDDLRPFAHAEVGAE